MKLLVLHCAIVLWWQMPVNAYSQNTSSATVTRKDVHFKSGGVKLAGWLYLPATVKGKKLPAIVMAPGFSGTRECNYQFFASAFAEAGLIVLLYDYPNFGKSDGTMRGEIDPWQQVASYRDGISFLETVPEADPERIGLWGGSYSGGHVLAVGALDPRVRCLVAMTPFVSGSAFLKHLPEESRNFLYHQFQADRLQRLKGGPAAKIPVATPGGDGFAAIASPHAWEFIESFKSYAPTYENSVTLRSLEMQLEYEPGYYIPQIEAVPKLFIIARRDEIMPESQITEAYQKAGEPKQCAYIEGHHFSPYMEQRQEAIQLAIQWFKAHLL